MKLSLQMPLLMIGGLRPCVQPMRRTAAQLGGRVRMSATVTELDALKQHVATVAGTNPAFADWLDDYEHGLVHLDGLYLRRTVLGLRFLL